MGIARQVSQYLLWSTKGFLGVDDPVGRGPRPQEEDFLKPRYFTQLKATSPDTHQGRNVGTDPTFTVSPKPRIPLISHFSMCPDELGSLDGGSPGTIPETM